MPVVDTIIGGSWLAFWIYWLVASLSAKATRTRSRSGLVIRLAILAVLAASVQARVFTGHAAVHNPWLLGTGLSMFVSGLVLAVWARVYLGRNWGTPMAEKVDPDLVTTGPYRYVRHPIYSGIILAMIGTAMAMSPSWVVAVVVLGGYFIHSARVEERNMERLFPDAYPTYKRSTKMLIPFVY